MRFADEYYRHVPDCRPTPRATGTSARRGAWLFTPDLDPGLETCTYLRDEHLQPQSGEGTWAAQVVRRSLKQPHGALPPVIQVFVRGAVHHPGEPTLWLDEWHRAVRVDADAEAAGQPRSEQDDLFDGVCDEEDDDEDDDDDEMSADARELGMIFFRCAFMARRIRLPREFERSFGGRFMHCLACREPLVDTGRKVFSAMRVQLVAMPYFIVKEVHRGEPWVEYALCLGCTAGLQSHYSTGTTAAIDRLFLEHAHLQERFRRLNAGPAPMRDWLARCVLTGDRIDPRGTYQLNAYCEGGRLVLSALPYAIGERGMAMFEGCFSAESAQVRDSFMRRYLGVDAAV
ncbi:MAG: hypothetical protein IH621_13100 [Krumholzibacteria bacterium]|nr:hypothetical protein [Candidatus Krumholzibacteria bacterium]